ncbi:MAG: hypothetical protein AMJ73_08090 [candidate division Zixibacteria bacterium SM1_73]|nr:MAG: hypothetical protein AMJ73_08090 [candidate division Zixibacteria bacterium SM1_73]
MIVKKSFLIMSVIFLSLTSNLWADSGDGGYAGSFQQLGLGARALGMGGAFVAVADDATAGFRNPAGLVQVQMRTFGASYRKMTLDRRLGYITYCQPIREEATISIGWTNVGVSDVKGRNENGEITEEIKNYENAVELFFGRKILNELSVGLRIGYVQYNLANISAYGVGFGFSAFGKPIQKLRLGAAVENLGMRYSWTSGDYWKKFDLLGSSSKDEFPINLRAGVSYLLLEDRILLSTEVEKNEKQTGRIHFGLEGWILESLAVRGGYDRGSLTLGMGLRQKMGGSTILGFDYAYVGSRVDDDPDHLISLQLEF